MILLFVGCRGASIIPRSLRTAWSGSGLAAAFAVGLVKVPDNSRNTNGANKSKTKTNTNLLLVRGTSWRRNHVLTSCYIPVFSVGRSLACCIWETFLYCSWESLSCLKNKGTVRTWSDLICSGRLRQWALVLGSDNILVDNFRRIRGSTFSFIIVESAVNQNGVCGRAETEGEKKPRR